MTDFSSLLSSANSSEETLIEVSDYLTFSDIELQEKYLEPASEHQQNHFLLQANGDQISKSSIGVCSKSRNTVKSSLKGNSKPIAFKTKSELEVLNDGYSWRKYGKKMVKDTPHPRNYYRCSTKGCDVKKRVEREREDPSYVITTYEGTHNHPVPSSLKKSQKAPGSYSVSSTSLHENHF